MGNVLTINKRQQRSNVILISSSVPVADVIKRQLELTMGASCHVWDCADEEQAADLISVQELIPMEEPEIDAVIMDLSSPGTDYPKERFLNAKRCLPLIPIVVLTDRTDYDLMQYVMVEGAADSLSIWQLNTDPDRMRHVIESCHARDVNSKKAQQRSLAELAEIKRQAADAIKSANDKNDAILKYMQERSALELRKANADNEVLRKEIQRAAATLQDAQNRSYAVLKHVQQRSALDLKEVQDMNAQFPILQHNDGNGLSNP